MSRHSTTVLDAKSLACSLLTCLAFVFQGAINNLVAQDTANFSSDSAVAKVGDFTITMAAVDKLAEERFPKLDQEKIDSDSLLNLRRAAALSLVRRELAYQRLIELGGNPLESRIRRKIDSEAKGLQRIDAAAVLTRIQQRDIAWNVAWGEYLETHVTNGNLQKYFQSVAWRYDGSQVRVAQIFSSESDANEKLQQLKQKIEANEVTFAAAAQEHSKAPSASGGGDLGWVQYYGDLPLEVADQVFAGEPKTLIGPVRSALGWHLVMLNEKQAGAKKFEELEDHATLRRDAADFLFARLVRSGSQAHNVEWTMPQFKPPASELIAP